MPDSTRHPVLDADVPFRVDGILVQADRVYMKRTQDGIQVTINGHAIIDDEVLDEPSKVIDVDFHELT